MENDLTIFHFDLLLRDGLHDLDFTLKLQFQVFITLHAGGDSGIRSDGWDKKLDLQHTFLHGLQTEKYNGELEYCLLTGDIIMISYGIVVNSSLGTANQGELRDVLVYEVKRDGVSSSALGASINHTQPDPSLHIIVGDLDISCDDILPSVVFHDRSGFSGVRTCWHPMKILTFSA